MDALYSPTLTGVSKITVAWTLRTVIAAAALLRDAQREGMDLAGVLKIIDTAVHQPRAGAEDQACTKAPVCRRCGAQMYQCFQASALAGQPVYVCSVKCGYSTISEGE